MSALVLNQDCRTLPAGELRNRCRRETIHQLQEEWIARLAFGGERVMDQWIQSWLGIFPVNWNDIPSLQLLIGQIEAIRGALSGTYADLLQAMVLDPALQISLNGLTNRREKPNENLARELLELFSLGLGHYGENDVIQAARALTGYRLHGDDTLTLDPRRHDDGAKTILGRTANFDAASLAVWLCQQPATADNILRRLWRERVGPLPTRARLQTIAAGWRRMSLSLPWLMRSLDAAPEAVASRSAGLLLANPITVVSRSLALLGSHHPEALSISRVHLSRMGQLPFEPPSVKGWPVSEQWLNLRWLQARRRGLATLLANEEVWAARQLPAELSPSLTPLQPLTLKLPADPSRGNLARLFADPVWQLA
jgi:uncharacterized protein (DUF1800 family)